MGDVGRGVGELTGGADVIGVVMAVDDVLDRFIGHVGDGLRQIGSDVRRRVDQDDSITCREKHGLVETVGDPVQPVPDLFHQVTGLGDGRPPRGFRNGTEFARGGHGCGHLLRARVRDESHCQSAHENEREQHACNTLHGDDLPQTRVMTNELHHAAGETAQLVSHGIQPGQPTHLLLAVKRSMAGWHRNGRAASGLQHLSHRRDGALDVPVTGLPVADRNPHAAFASPRGATEERFTGLQDALDHQVGAPVMVHISRSRSRLEESDESLVESRRVDEFGAREGADAGHEGMSVVAGAFHQVGHPGPAKLAQSGVGATPRPRRDHSGVHSLGSRAAVVRVM